MLWKTTIGSTVLYAIEDGWSHRDPHTWFIGSTPEAWVGHEEHLTAESLLPVAYGCFLIDDGERLVMVDTGFGVNASPMDNGEAGRMPAGLASLGYAPTDVTDVVHTHLHPDHILGDLETDMSTPFFANATYWTLRAEADYWLSGVNERSHIVAPIVEALQTADVLSVVETVGSILPDIEMVPTFGHTPGHTSILVSAGDDAVMIAGDVTHSPMQVIHTNWNIGPDIDKEAAAESRAKFFEDMAATGIPVAGGHWYRPGFGRIATREGRLTFQALPVEEVG
jgi:glyoxylase-like metal-dependent hydrolase (beta-lactamase superfamily II)